MSKIKGSRKSKPVERVLVVALDEFNAPRAFGIADTLDDATDEASKQAAAYIASKKEIGDTVTLRLFEHKVFGDLRDLKTVIR
jgi:hypothetical protein